MSSQIIPATWKGSPQPFYNVWEGPRDPAVQEAIKAGMSKQDFVAKQWREVVSGPGPTAFVTCECGLTMPLRFAFRCLYCGQWYCTRCAEAHFGKTRKQYREEIGAAL